MYGNRKLSKELQSDTKTLEASRLYTHFSSQRQKVIKLKSNSQLKSPLKQSDSGHKAMIASPLQYQSTQNKIMKDIHQRQILGQSIEQFDHQKQCEKIQNKKKTVTYVASPSQHEQPRFQQNNKLQLQAQQKIQQKQETSQIQKLNQQQHQIKNQQSLIKVPSCCQLISPFKYQDRNQIKSKQSLLDQLKRNDDLLLVAERIYFPQQLDRDQHQKNEPSTIDQAISLIQIHHIPQKRNDDLLPFAEGIFFPQQLDRDQNQKNEPSTIDQVKSLIQINDIPQEKDNPSPSVQLISRVQLKNQQFSIDYLDHCNCIQLDSTSYFVMSKFTIYLGQFNIETTQKQGIGCILQKYYDRDFNTSYFHYEGQFNNDQIVGSGKLFQQKFKTILQEDDWSSIQRTLNRQPEIAIKPRTSKIKISGISISDNSNFRRFDSKIGFHDQLLSQTDIDILNTSSWLNSSIIDAYIEHLNYQYEIQYWASTKESRQQQKRMHIFPSWVFSLFHFGQDIHNWNQFQVVISQFEPIQYKIQKIYKRIGFAINKSNTHWYFVQLDFETMEILVKDSLRGNERNYDSTKEIINSLFHKIDKNIKFKVRVCQKCKQQNNGYDCGAYTCINAKEFAEDKTEEINTGAEMRKFLINFLQLEFKKN